MRHLTLSRLKQAVHSAALITQLEAAKDGITTQSLSINVPVTKTADNPFGQHTIQVTAPRELLVKEITEQINAERQVLLAMGIDLTPGE